MSSIVTLLIVLLAPATHTGAQASQRTALTELTKQMPRVVWQETPQTADFDCDGRPDHAFLGTRDGRVIVAFRLTRPRRIQSFEFGIGTSAQDLCEVPAEIQVEDQDFDPSDEVPEVEGFRSSKTCKGLELRGGDCDLFHFYWNHVAKKMDWWRL